MTREEERINKRNGKSKKEVIKKVIKWKRNGQGTKREKSIKLLWGNDKLVIVYIKGKKEKLGKQSKNKFM